jgi:hypothetical protein
MRMRMRMRTRLREQLLSPGSGRVSVMSLARRFVAHVTASDLDEDDTPQKDKRVTTNKRKAENFYTHAVSRVSGRLVESLCAGYG